MDEAASRLGSGTSGLGLMGSIKLELYWQPLYSLPVGWGYNLHLLDLWDSGVVIGESMDTALQEACSRALSWVVHEGSTWEHYLMIRRVYDGDGYGYGDGDGNGDGNGDGDGNGNGNGNGNFTSSRGNGHMNSMGNGHINWIHNGHNGHKVQKLHYLIYSTPRYVSNRRDGSSITQRLPAQISPTGARASHVSLLLPSPSKIESLAPDSGIAPWGWCS